MNGNQTESSLAEKRITANNLLKASFEAVIIEKQVEKAQKSYDLAKEYDLHAPWTPFCAYRLAHLLMHIPANVESASRAASLFLEATTAECLGPYPAIYRLAALERLQPGNQEKLKEGFEKALRLFEKIPISARTEKNGKEETHYRNMITLAAYYFGYHTQSMTDYSPMEWASNWILVGGDPKLAKVKCSKEFVLQEIDDLSSRHPDAVFFKLSHKDPSNPEVLERHWKSGRNHWQTAPHYPALKLLSLLLKGTPTTMAGLKANLYATDNAFAQIKKRLKSGLAELLGRPKDQIFISAPGEFPSMNKEIRIFGAVET